MNFKTTNLAFWLSLLFIGVIATISVNAWTVTSFPPSNFWVVDETDVPLYWNPGWVEGYKVDTLTDSNKVTHYQYQMTDTAQFMYSAIWNNKFKLDLTKNFVLDFKLYFGRGRHDWNHHLKAGDRDHDISDGMCFVLHTKDSSLTKKLIGPEDMGYCTQHRNEPAIYPLTIATFAVEWDNQFSHMTDRRDTVDLEGFMMIQDTNVSYWHTITRNHISYLKNAEMATIKRKDGTPAVGQMQNNWGGVAYNDWFNVRIEWIRNYDSNGTPYYDLLTYMQEGPSKNEGTLLLRNTMRFNSLNELIDGLQPDSNCQALVNWGITCASGNVPNNHKVEFLRLTNYDTDSLKDNIPFVIAVEYNLQDSQAVTRVYDTLYTSTLGCNGSYTLPHHSNILTIDSVCFAEKDSARIYIKGLDDTTGAYWRFENAINIPIKSDQNGIYFDFNDSVLAQKLNANITLGHGIYAWGNINLKLVLPSQGIEIKFNLNTDRRNYILDHLSQALDIPIDTATNSLIIEVDSTKLYKSFVIPGFYDCSYIVLADTADTNFVTPPSQDSNRIMSFELKPGICSANIPMKLQCECDRPFNLLVKNTDCQNNIALHLQKAGARKTAAAACSVTNWRFL